MMRSPEAWKEAVAAALRLQGLLVSSEKTAELRTFVGVRMQFRHLSSSPHWAEWFEKELKAVVLHQLRRLERLSGGGATGSGGERR